MGKQKSAIIPFKICKEYAPYPITLNIGWGLSTKKGFTLIEILIVVLIISIAITFATLNLGKFLQNRKTVAIADQLIAQMQLAQQQAILQSTVIGLHINAHDYFFAQWQPRPMSSGQWQVLTHDRLLNKQSLPNDIQLKIELPNRSTQTSSAPQIIFQNSGDISSFTLLILKNNEGQQIFVNKNGQIQQTVIKK